MEKYFEEWNGKKFPVRKIQLPEELGGFVANVADFELWNEIKYHVEQLRDLEASRIDNDIYYYCESGFIASDPTDEDIVEYLLYDC